jgi:hypothetical protein
MAGAQEGQVRSWWYTRLRRLIEGDDEDEEEVEVKGDEKWSGCLVGKNGECQQSVLRYERHLNNHNALTEHVPTYSWCRASAMIRPSARS